MIVFKLSCITYKLDKGYTTDDLFTLRICSTTSIQAELIILSLKLSSSSNIKRGPNRSFLTKCRWIKWLGVLRQALRKRRAAKFSTTSQWPLWTLQKKNEPCLKGLSRMYNNATTFLDIGFDNIKYEPLWGWFRRQYDKSSTRFWRSEVYSLVNFAIRPVSWDFDFQITVIYSWAVQFCNLGYPITVWRDT